MRSIDNTTVRASQISRLDRIRAARDEGAVKQALEALTTAARDKKANGSNPSDIENNLLHLSVVAARARCTVGEISDALETEFGRYVPDASVVRGAYGSEMNKQHEDTVDQVIQRCEVFEREFGRRPRLLVVALTTLHIYIYIYTHIHIYISLNTLH